MAYMGRWKPTAYCDPGRHLWEEKAPRAREGGRPSQEVAILLRESEGEWCKSIFPSMPKGTMLEHLKGYAFKEPLLENLRLYNIELISIAIAPYVTDYVIAEYSPNDNRGNIEFRVPSQIPEQTTEFLEVLDGEDAEHLHVRVKLRYFPPGAGSGVTYHEILIDAAFEIVDAPYGEAGEHVYQSLHADLPQLPVFSHLLSDPVIGPGQK